MYIRFLLRKSNCFFRRILKSQKSISMLLVPIPGVPIPCGLQKYFVVILDFTGHKSLVSDVEIP